MGPIYLAILTACALSQPNRARLDAGIIHVSVTLLHTILFLDLNRSYYYLTAALANYMAIWLLGRIEQSNLSINLIVITLACLLTNIYGFIIYEQGLPPGTYNNAFLVIYIFSLIALLKRDGHNADRGFGVNRPRPSIIKYFNWRGIQSKTGDR